MNTTPTSSGYRLLVADDEPELREAYRRVFQDFLADGKNAPQSQLDELSAELFSPKAGSAAPIADAFHIDDIAYCTQGEQTVAEVEAAAAAGRPFALVILDMRMPPGIDGLETARRIRSMDHDINIVVVTGYSDHRPSEIATAVGSPDKLFYLVKPFEPSELQQLVRALTERWALERKLKSDLKEGLGRLDKHHAELAESIKRGDQLAEDAKAQQRLLDAALSNLPHGLCMFDSDKRLLLSNARYGEMYNLPPELLKPGTALKDIFAYRKKIGNAPTDVPNYLTHHGLNSTEGGMKVFEFPLDDGRTIRIRHLNMIGGSYVATHEDITEAVRDRTRINHLARHDALTGLPNRVAFREKLREAMAGVSPERRIAVLCLDLDQFKGVNDTLGHPAGDALLSAAAARLRECVGEGGVLARVGGDDFAVVQVGEEQPAGATELARKITTALGRPYDVDGHHVVIGASVGIALAPDDSEDPDKLLKSADLALDGAKNGGRGTFRFFEPTMDAEAQTRRRLEMGLRRALAKEEFELHYQPLVNLSDNSVTGFEALLRWRDPERGLVPPGEFVPLAEDTGLIVPIGDWVIRRACAEAATWPENLRVAVNLSAAQFRGDELVNVIFGALAESHLRPDRLELEITESVLLKDNAATLATLHRLRDFGVRISMDDFGTGYSSLSYLRSFPFDKIKIDQSFIRDLNGSDNSLAIVRAVTGLGAALHMTITAEGVETPEQLEFLRREGLSEVQGFLFSKPRPSSELTEFFAAPKGPRAAAA